MAEPVSEEEDLDEGEEAGLSLAAMELKLKPQTLENFDAIGRFREQEKDKPVDASGSYLTRTGETVQFSGPAELAKFLADSPEVHSSIVERLFHHMIKQPIRAYGPDVLPRLRESFTKKEFNIQELTADIVTEAAMRH